MYNGYSITAKDLVMFILRHRKFKAFIDWSIPQMIQCILSCASAGTLAYCADKDGVSGIMLGEIKGSRFYIINILSIKRNMPYFVAHIVNNFKQCTHAATIRHGRSYKEYPITQFTTQRFMKGTA